MPYLPFTEILNYLAMHPGRWFGESHLGHLYPAARAEVPEVLRILAQSGRLRTQLDDNRRPLYQLVAVSGASGPVSADHPATAAATGDSAATLA